MTIKRIQIPRYIDQHKPVMATVWREVYSAATRTTTASRFLPVKNTIKININKNSLISLFNFIYIYQFDISFN